MLLLLVLLTNFFITKGQTSDLIYQADGVFTKLNSNGTEDMVSKISQNLLQTLKRFNSNHTVHTTHRIIDNLEKLTEHSKIYVNINDEKMNRILILVEILLILLISILIFLFCLCIFKVYKQKKSPALILPSTNFYNPLVDHRNSENVMIS